MMPLGKWFYSLTLFLTLSSSSSPLYHLLPNFLLFPFSSFSYPVHLFCLLHCRFPRFIFFHSLSISYLSSSSSNSSLFLLPSLLIVFTPYLSSSSPLSLLLPLLIVFSPYPSSFSLSMFLLSSLHFLTVSFLLIHHLLPFCPSFSPLYLLFPLLIVLSN